MSVDGKPALLWNHGEIGTAAALSAEHQDRIARLLRSYSGTSGALFHFVLQRLETRDDAMHAFERVHTLVLQTDVCGLSEYLHTQRNRSAVRIPNHPARRLRQQHAQAVAAQQSFTRQPRRPARASSFFVGNQRHNDSAIQFCANFFECANGIEHRDDAAFHVAGAAAKQKMLLADGLKLLGGLRGNHIVMPVKIERSLSASVTRLKTDGRTVSLRFRISRRPALAVQPKFTHSNLE